MVSMWWTANWLQLATARHENERVSILQSPSETWMRRVAPLHTNTDGNAPTEEETASEKWADDAIPFNLSPTGVS